MKKHSAYENASKIVACCKSDLVYALYSTKIHPSIKETVINFPTHSVRIKNIVIPRCAVDYSSLTSVYTFAKTSCPNIEDKSKALWD